jgi:hypothetical protein
MSSNDDKWDSVFNTPFKRIEFCILEKLKIKKSFLIAENLFFTKNKIHPIFMFCLNLETSPSESANELIWHQLFTFYERSIKYWSRDFQKYLFLEYLDEIGLFFGEKPIFTKKKTRRSAVVSWLSFLARNFSFCITLV